jgi:hypothetical protein
VFPIDIVAAGACEIGGVGGSASRSSGEWRDDDYDVRENGTVIDRADFLGAVRCTGGRPWMWTSGHNGQIARAAHGFEATRETTI